VSGQCYYRFFRVAPEKAGYLADDVNFFCTAGLTDLSDPGFSGVTVSAKPDLYQLVMVQSGFNFRHDIFTQTLVANHDNGLQMVGQSAQVTNLLGCEWHVAIPAVANWECIQGSEF